MDATKRVFPDVEFYVAAAGNVTKQVNDVEDLVATVSPKLECPLCAKLECPL